MSSWPANVPDRALWEDHFWSRLNPPDDPDACWPWPWARSSAGYGQMRLPPTRILHYTHRLALLLTTGEWSSPGDDTDHAVCDNPPCANPRHLRIVIHAVNCTRWLPVGTCLRGHDRAIYGYERKDRPGAWNCRACSNQRRKDLRNAAHTSPPDPPGRG